MRLYKFTGPDDETRNNTQWGPGVEHTTDGSGDLCSAGWLHAYANPIMAVMLDAAHGTYVEDYANPHLWVCEGGGEIRDHYDKIGCTRLTTLERVEIPEVTAEQRQAFGVVSAWRVHDEPSWRRWARKWLSGEDRTEEAARAAAWSAARAAEAARAAARAANTAVLAARLAGWAASEDARSAVRAAARAADAASWAMVASRAAEAASWVSACAVSAVRAADAASWAAEYARRVGMTLPLDQMSRAVVRM